MRSPTTALAVGTIWFATSSSRGASKASTLMDAFASVRSAIVPEPSSCTSGYTCDSSRKSSSEICIPDHVNACSPGTATSPRSSWSDARMRLSAMTASGSGPPKVPLCCAIGRTSTRTRKAVAPRTLVPIVGTPVR